MQDCGCNSVPLKSVGCIAERLEEALQFSQARLCEDGRHSLNSPACPGFVVLLYELLDSIEDICLQDWFWAKVEPTYVMEGFSTERSRKSTVLKKDPTSLYQHTKFIMLINWICGMVCITITLIFDVL